MDQLDRRTYLKTAGAATAGMIGLAGCASDNGDGDGTGGDGQTYGTLSTLVTDQPNDIGDFEELIVTIDGIWLKPAGGESGDGDEDDDEDESPDDEQESTPTNGTATPTNETATPTDDTATPTNQTATPTNQTATPESRDEPEATEEPEDADEDDSEEGDSGRYYVEFDEPQQADLVQLQGGETQLVDETEVETGQYQFLQLDVSNTEGILAESGEQADVETPGNAPLKFNTSFEIRADEETQFVADFAPHQTGQGKYIIRPVATGTQVLYGDEEYQPDEGDSSDGGSGDGGTGGSGNGGRRNGGQRDETETSDGTGNQTTTAQS